MIELPEEIVHMIHTIEAAGYEAYAVGGCVRDSILGRHPDDWDLTSNASREVLEKLFSGASVVNRQLGVMRIKEGSVTADIAAYRIDGEYTDYRRPDAVIFTREIGEDLKRRDFTMNAIAVSPERGVVDPFCGRADIDKKLIRGIGDPHIRFEEDALRILRGIRFSAQLDFQIDQPTLRAMEEKAELLEYISIERIREEFTKTITAASAGKGLKLYRETGILRYILGKDCVENAEEPEWQRLQQLEDHIDQTDRDFYSRAALVYLCFKKDKATEAIGRMAHSNEMKKLLELAVTHLEDFERICDEIQLKKFLFEFGTDCYHAMIRLLEQHHKIQNDDSESWTTIKALYESIRVKGDPVFIRDLVIDGNDLKNAGIREGKEIGSILKSLLDIVHRSPYKNDKQTLISIARKVTAYSRNKE